MDRAADSLASSDVIRRKVKRWCQDRTVDRQRCPTVDESKFNFVTPSDLEPKDCLQRRIVAIPAEPCAVRIRGLDGKLDKDRIQTVK